ncbi:MAG: M23 family metallopeptidase [Alphaproteobacteria bacterium]
MALAGFAVVVAGVTTFIVRGHYLSKTTDALADTRASHQILLGSLGDYRDRFTAIGRELDDGGRDLATVIERSRALRQSLTSLKTKAVDSDGEPVKQAGVPEPVARQLDALEAALRALSGRDALVRTEIAAVESRLALEPGPAPDSSEPDSALVTRIKSLERRVASLQASEADLIKKLTESTAANIGEAERAIRSAGLDADRLIDSAKGRGGLGGPFVAFRPEMLRRVSEDTGRVQLDYSLGRWNELRTLLRALPLTAPMPEYEVASGFGQRQDPFNGGLAIHNGLDLTGPLGSPIYATAPGLVSFAGWRDRFGKMVEIDHGLGVRTRYGHLRQIGVGPGQWVGPGDVVGEMGSTGRSTGPHLHYEVLLNDEPQDPMKFIEAGVRVHKN